MILNLVDYCFYRLYFYIIFMFSLNFFCSDRLKYFA